MLQNTSTTSENEAGNGNEKNNGKNSLIIKIDTSYQRRIRKKAG
jgi:hypothetical protein